MASGFRILEHPADLGIEAIGESLAEAYEYAARGLMSVILDTSSVKLLESRELRIEASDREQLLFRWLSEVLYLYDGQRFASTSFSVAVRGDTHLQATIRGEPFDPERHLTRMDVKAITYHQLTVSEHNTGNIVVQVFLDI